MEDLLKKIAEESGIEPAVVEEILEIERKLVYKKRRHFRGDFNRIVSTSAEKEASEQ